MQIDFQLVDHNVTNPDEQYEEVPIESGLYGWYYNFERLKGFVNNSQMLKKNLLEISSKLKNPEFRAILYAKFGNSFKGEMEYIGRFKENEINARIDVLSNEELEAMLDILQHFTQPLYIGIAKNLRERYMSHYHSIFENICVTDKEKGKCFGHRIQQQNIKIEELVYKYQTLNMDRSNIEKIEYIANRFFKPIFGRR